MSSAHRRSVSDQGARRAPASIVISLSSPASAAPTKSSVTVAGSTSRLPGCARPSPATATCGRTSGRASVAASASRIGARARKPPAALADAGGTGCQSREGRPAAGCDRDWLCRPAVAPRPERCLRRGDSGKLQALLHAARIVESSTQTSGKCRLSSDRQSLYTKTSFALVVEHLHVDDSIGILASCLDGSSPATDLLQQIFSVPGGRQARVGNWVQAGVHLLFVKGRASRHRRQRSRQLLDDCRRRAVISIASRCFRRKTRCWVCCSN